MRALLWSFVSAALAISCSSSKPSVPEARFANRPTVWAVDDRRDVAKKPSETLSLMDYDFYERSFEQPLVEPMEVERAHRAHGINALDEVPDSTWFTNRISKRTLTPEEIRQGPIQSEGPEAFVPWTVLSTKSGGASHGLIITDSRGIKYMIKFETPGFPELESGAQVVSNRLLWAAGYHVPQDTVVYFRPDALRIAPDAKVKGQIGNTIGRLDQKKLDRELSKIFHGPDGRIRVVASRWIDGVGLGGTPPDGVRVGDPNDKIPHERRRDLRGQLPIFAWIDYVDLPRSNGLDMFVTDPRDPRRHYVEHYRIDFDSSLGAIGAVLHDERQGYANAFDWGDLFTEIGTVGLRPRPWRTNIAPHLDGVAPQFSAENFNPPQWKPNIPYAPFDKADRFDGYWGAKIVARFTPDQIRAAVEAGRYSDPRTVDYLTETLIKRQRKVVEYFFSHVNPLENFVANPTGLCFDDLAITKGLTLAGPTHYVLTSRDRSGRPFAKATIGAAASGSTCVTTLPFAAGYDSYTIVEIDTLRENTKRTMYVHLARDPVTSQPRVIGLWRI